MFEYNSIKELVDIAIAKEKNISDLVLEDQSEDLGKTKEESFIVMKNNFKIMRETVADGMKKTGKSSSGLSGGDAFKMNTAFKNGRTFGGRVLNRAIIKALAASEVNAGMGRIVAAPTAGSCGIIPAVLLTAQEELDIPDKNIIMSLFTSAAIGMVIARNASISGAEGGCQAECGSAAAMAAGALVELLGGSPLMIAHACAIALKNVMGLVCDPVAGLVEVPCIKRNAAGAVNAILAADLAIAGIESVIPADEVIAAMKLVGNQMASSLKETAEGGLAATPTGCRIARECTIKL